jgi:hypothetical protein|tara:strand:+ start:296 stop:439 length:144 start_codon:yes stop_codon:yes gene_type:complete
VKELNGMHLAEAAATSVLPCWLSCWLGGNAGAGLVEDRRLVAPKHDA